VFSKRFVLYELLVKRSVCLKANSAQKNTVKSAKLTPRKILCIYKTIASKNHKPFNRELPNQLRIKWKITLKVSFFMAQG